jgi:hypothetical protein
MNIIIIIIIIIQSTHPPLRPFVSRSMQAHIETL